MSKVVLDSGAPAVVQCTAEGRLLGTKESPIVKQAHLSERLNQLQSIASLLNFVKPVTVHIRQHLNDQLLITPGRVDMSADLLKRPRLFEKAVMFGEFANESDFAAAVKSDFLLDENVWGVPSKKPGQSDSWITDLKGLGNYCRSKHVIVAHRTYCAIHNEYGDSFIVDQKLGATTWGLVPVFVRALEKAYATLGFRQKERFLNYLMFLTEPSNGSVDSIRLAKTFKQANARFVAILKNWLMPLMLDREATHAAVQAVTIAAHAPIRYLVIDRSARDVFPIDQIEMGKWQAPSKITFVEYGIRQYVVSSDVTHQFKRARLFKNHSVQRVVYVSCDIPQVQNLVQFDSGVKRVLYVKQCTPSAIDWPQAFKVGLNNYLSSHPSAQFMEFNLSSLRLARKLEGPLRHPSLLANWSKWLKWQSVVTDGTEPTALRPLAVIDGVRRFRMF